MADKVSKKERLTEIQKAEILKDNVKKITKHQKLYTEYFWNKYNTSKTFLKYYLKKLTLVFK